MPMKLTTEQKQNLVARYHNGESVANICFETYISRSTFYTWIKEFEKIYSASKRELTLVDVNSLKRQLAKKDTIIQILKSVDCTTSAPLKEKLYELEKFKDKFRVNLLCEALEVDKGTFYNHILRNKKQDTSYKKRREEISLLVKEIFDESNQIYGANKIHAVLKERAIEASPEYIRGIMNELELRSIRTNAKRDYLKLNAKKRPDLLKRDFTAARPNELGGHNAVKLGVGRELIHKRQNDIAIKEQTLTDTAACHIRTVCMQFCAKKDNRFKCPFIVVALF